jgi:ammonium transporter Rh
MMKKKILIGGMIIILTLLAAVQIWAEPAAANPAIDGLRQVQQYNFSINILAMLLIGFGFLMVFAKKYGYGATTGTFLVIGIGLPLYLFLRSTGILSAAAIPADTIKGLLFAEFGVAAALIAMGAILGRVKLYQYLIIAVLVIPVYMINEWLVIDGGLGITKGFVDTAGSVSIHAFGAYFGLGLAFALTRKQDRAKAVGNDPVSNRFSLIGSMILWLFWPSFCSALVGPDQFQVTVINTILALCGATLSTYLLSRIFGKGKVNIGDIANASLAGGVAIGATCNVVSPPVAFVIGIAAGALCVFGYAKIQGKLQNIFKFVDTCGVHNLHGMPGILGGIIAVFVVPGIVVPQLVGILFTVVLALVSGVGIGFVVRLTGNKKDAYEDGSEFENAASE